MPFTQVTLADLLSELKARWESQPFWTDPEGVIYLNQALRYWNLLTGMWQVKVSVGVPDPPILPSPWVLLPGSLTYGTRVTYNNLPNLEIASIPELDRLHPQWRGETTASGGAVPSTPRRWAPVGMRQIAVWPSPAAGGTFLIDGCAATPILTLPFDFVDLGKQDQNAITGFALYLSSFKRGASSLMASKPLFDAFMQAALQQNDRLRYSTYFRKVLSLDKGRTGKPFISLQLPTTAAAGGAASDKQQRQGG